MKHSSYFKPALVRKLIPEQPVNTVPDLVALAIRAGDCELYTLAAIYLYRAVERHFRAHPPRDIERFEDDWRELRAEFGFPSKQWTIDRRWGLKDLIMFAWLRHEISGEINTLNNVFDALNVRNLSWLAHGDRVVTGEEWTAMTAALLPLVDYPVE